jgi:hypothetical protein
MIPVTGAEQAFKRLLSEEGFAPTAPSLAPAWAAFKRFCHIGVECTDDGFLCQWGTYSSAPDEFEFDLTRQFSLEEDGEYSGMEQLHLTLVFPAALGEGIPGGTCWASDFATVEDFLAHVAALPAFRVAMGGGAARSAAIHQEEV